MTKAKASFAPTAKTAGKNLAAFRAVHDKNVVIPAKIKKALADMLREDPENWDYEMLLMKRAGVSTTDLAAFRQQFEPHIVETGGKNPKRVWFASPRVAEKARV